MRDLVDDEVLDTSAVVGDAGAVGADVRSRFDGLLDRFSGYASYPAPLELWDSLAAAFRSPRSARPSTSRHTGHDNHCQ